jgi:hypothetical protein
LPEFFLAKRLELKSLKGQTKAEELGPRGPQFGPFLRNARAKPAVKNTIQI